MVKGLESYRARKFQMGILKADTVAGMVAIGKPQFKLARFLVAQDVPAHLFRKAGVFHPGFVHRDFVGLFSHGADTLRESGEKSKKNLLGRNA